MPGADRSNRDRLTSSASLENELAKLEVFVQAASVHLLDAQEQHVPLKTMAVLQLTDRCHQLNRRSRLHHRLRCHSYHLKPRLLCHLFRRRQPLAATYTIAAIAAPTDASDMPPPAPRAP